MPGTEAVNDAVTRHLLEAIERVRDDVAKVEFWAGAVAGFARPVPAYEPDGASVWLPTEQASALRSKAPEPESRDVESPAPKQKRRASGKNGKSAAASKARQGAD
jgi:hypothetical protein